MFLGMPKQTSGGEVATIQNINLETNTTQLTMLPDKHSRRLPSQQEQAGDPGQGSMWRRNPKAE